MASSMTILEGFRNGAILLLPLTDGTDRVVFLVAKSLARDSNLFR